VNIRIGTHGGLTLTSRGTGGVYRVDGDGRLPAGLVPLGVTRPPGTWRFTGLAMGDEIRRAPAAWRHRRRANAARSSPSRGRRERVGA
jgi:hypothetical protein